MRPDMFGWLTVNGGGAFVFLLEQKVQIFECIRLNYFAKLPDVSQRTLNRPLVSSYECLLLD